MLDIHEQEIVFVLYNKKIAGAATSSQELQEILELFPIVSTVELVTVRGVISIVTKENIEENNDLPNGIQHTL